MYSLSSTTMLSTIIVDTVKRQRTNNNKLLLQNSKEFLIGMTQNVRDGLFYLVGIISVNFMIALLL